MVVCYGFTQAQSNHTHFFQHSSNDQLAILIVYIDDVILRGNNLPALESLKGILDDSFEMKDLGSLWYFLDIEVVWSSQGICLSQREYVIDPLTENNLLLCKPTVVLMDQNEKLLDVPNVRINKTHYQRLVRKLIYLAHTSPNICHTIRIVNSCMIPMSTISKLSTGFSTI
ncbi:uncharacterized protein LOC110038592 [Phalaenopsis equestris]|uniref:uncharacterized protein LOC110038592 n=1 Tax=Phalaenopsis equestris TaxID=78828 RepID=UPI0009E27256|nr:uncharacterized protein LOC110038592 [Phalaenopsis equestris]